MGYFVRVLDLMDVFLSRSMKGLRFYSTFQLTSCLAIVSQMMAENTRLLGQGQVNSNTGWMSKD